MDKNLSTFDFGTLWLLHPFGVEEVETKDICQVKRFLGHSCPIGFFIVIGIEMR